MRPERLRVAPAGTAPMACKVREAIYAGVATTYLLEAADGTLLRVRSASGQHAFDLPADGTVSISWAGADARAFAS